MNRRRVVAGLSLLTLTRSARHGEGVETLPRNRVSTVLILSGTLLLGCAVSTATAQTTANGPYYATPSWDQTLPSNTRFIVLSNMGNNAVLDRETGLVWERSPYQFGGTWEAAQDHCNALSVGNRKGWKLPTIQELGSLMDTSVPPTNLPSGHPFANVNVMSAYFSATNHHAGPVFGSPSVWALSFSNGGAVLAFKENTLGRWCVRGGQGVDLQ